MSFRPPVGAITNSAYKKVILSLIQCSGEVREDGFRRAQRAVAKAPEAKAKKTAKKR